MKLTTITILLFLLQTSLFAQQPTNYSQRYGGTSEKNGSKAEPKKNAVELDSAYYNYYHLTDIEKHTPYIDSTLSEFQQYDPARVGDIDYLHRGNPGSAATSIAYSPRTSSGFNIGYNAYDLYRIDEHNFKFFDLNRPINDLFFSPSQGQASFMVKAKFARSFSEGINLSMNYQRVLQSGFYDNQAVQNTSFGTGLHYASKSKKYQLITNLFVNNVSEQFNGGIATDTLFEDDFFNISQNIPVRIEDATIRKGEKKFVANQIYQLRDTSDWNIKLKHRLRVTGQDYRFSDAITTDSLDTVVYGDFLLETRGIRNAYKLNIIDNYAAVELVNKKSLSIEAGIDYARYQLDYTDRSETINSSFVRGKINTTFRDVVGFTGDVNLGLLDYAGDFDLGGNAFVDFKGNRLSGGLRLYNYTPNINHQYLSINSLLVWDNEFNKTYGTAVSGQLYIPKTKTTLGIKQSIENELVYFDNAGLPVQDDNTQSTTQLQIEQKISLWKFRYAVDFQYQVVSKDLYGLPPLFAKQSLYIEDRIFNDRMLVQLGADYRYIEFDQGLVFNPINASFYPTGESLAPYELLDVFLNFKISTFSVFVKQENFLDLFSTNINYLLPGQPDYNTRLRVGIRWFLLD